MKTVFIDWNLIPYAEAWQRQTEWFDNIVRAKVQGESYENRIVMCEHPHVYTLGRSGKENNMLLSDEQLKAIDATAGMGEDGFLLAAYGYEVTLYEQNPVIAALLKDALRRARKHPVLKDIASRMKLVEGDSVSCMEKLMDPVDVIYLDPMFPKRQKSGLINKKLQLIQKLEPPCSEEKDLFDAAIKAGPSRIIVKRPLKSVCLDGREPSYILKGKAIRYDCYVM